MKETIRFGRIAGVEVGANWSLIVLIAFVADGLAALSLPELAPGSTPAVYWSAGVISALLIAASLLLHELAHALVALRSGLPVQRITLWMLGGVSVLAGEPATARAAFWIALSGPLTSLGLGLGFGGSAILLDAAGAPKLIAMSALWLGAMNVFLGLFNLLPGIPLDGGRILRAVLWWRTGDPDRAEITAAKSGRVLGILIAATGMVQWLDGQLTGIWLVMVGGLILLSVTSEMQAARTRVAFGRMTVAAVMTRPGITGYASMSVERFVTDIAPHAPQAAFAVVDLDGHPTGTINLRRLAQVPAVLRRSTLLSDVQTPLKDVPVAAPDDLLTDLIARMNGGADELALVLEHDHGLVGVITGDDLARKVHLASLATAQPEPSPS